VERKNLKSRTLPARELRRFATDAERVLWSHLRNRQLEGCKFRRQVPIGPYIVDFVCFGTRLIVEADGPFHDTEADAVRDGWLKREGFVVLRFPNSQISQEPEAVLADILAASDIPVIIGPLFTSRSKVELRNRSLANPGKLAAAGVTIAITTDHPVVPINFLAHQAALSVKHGLDRDTALRALTINPARIVGIEDRLGSIEPGKDADLVIWSGDPLDVLSRVTIALMDGEEIYRYENGEATFAER